MTKSVKKHYRPIRALSILATVALVCMTALFGMSCGDARSTMPEAAAEEGPSAVSPTADRGPRVWFSISPQENYLVFPPHQSEYVASEFDMFKRTQAQIVVSPTVLSAASLDPKMAAVESVKDHKDAVGWLADHLIVDFPGQGQIMELRTTGVSADEAAVLLNVVGKAYLDEHRRIYRSARKSRLEELDFVHDNLSRMVRKRHGELNLLIREISPPKDEVPDKSAPEPTIDMQMRKRELAILKDTLDKVLSRRTQMDVEMIAPSRVRLLLIIPGKKGAAEMAKKPTDK